MPDQRDLHFGTDPALHPVTPNQQHKSATVLQSFFQTRHPAVAFADVFILKNIPAGLFQRGSQCNTRLHVGMAVAKKYLLARLDDFLSRHLDLTGEIDRVRLNRLFQIITGRSRKTMQIINM